MLTSFTRPWFARKVRASQGWFYTDGLERTQRRVLKELLRAARHTEIGQRYIFGNIESYEQFRSTVPAVEYPDIRRDVERMVNGERDVLWPGRCRRFAQSSGTSDGKSKYIPVTEDSLQLNHYAGASMSVAFYLNCFPESGLFDGKAFILGGSFANEVAHLPKDVFVGDLSANLIDHINPVVNLFRVPSKQIALMADWTKKLPALVDAAIRQNITNISGVPSWFLTVLKSVISQAGAGTIHDVWPNLEVFFHGGISFEPYREQYRAITDPSKMRYHENYNASEGFFAVQDSQSVNAMRLLADSGVFFEFIPIEADFSPYPEVKAPWEVEEGHTYQLLITSCNGLWRYAIGDTVRIESVEPLRIRIAGRTKSFINAFGEEVMVHNTDAAIASACAATGAQVSDYTAGPVFASNNVHAHHRWLIEWSTEPSSLEKFTTELDKALQAVNSDYQAKRSGNIFLGPPEIIPLPTGSFNRWLGATGKLGGQRKVPRLSNSPDLVNSILELIKSTEYNQKHK